MDFFLKLGTSKSIWRAGCIKFTSVSIEDTSSGDPSMPIQRSFPLPLCLNYTKDGFIPHLTWDLLKYVPDDNVPVLISLSSVYKLSSALKSCDSSLSKLLSNDFNRSIFLTNQDVLVSRRTGFTSSKYISIWTGSGRENIHPIDFIDCVKAFKPDVYQLLSDGETPKDASTKRLDKSVHNTIQLAQSIADLDWKSKPTFAAIEGGWNIQKRLSSIEKTKLLPVDGYVIDGLLAKDLLDDSLDNKVELQSLISQICSALPSDKPRALFGPLKPEIAIDVISAGIDIIDSSYCSYLTETETALLIDMKPDKIETVTSNLLNLGDESFKRDFTTISCDCKCYTCAEGFTRAYLNHLIKTKELLAPILLNLHNLFVYYTFINQIHIAFSQQQSNQKSDS